MRYDTTGTQLECPHCHSQNGSEVRDSRVSINRRTIRRRRECLACQQRYTTYESVVKLDAIKATVDRTRGMASRLRQLLEDIEASVDAERPVVAAVEQDGGDGVTEPSR